VEEDSDDFSYQWYCRATALSSVSIIFTSTVGYWRHILLALQSLVISILAQQTCLHGNENGVQRKRLVVPATRLGKLYHGPDGCRTLNRAHEMGPAG